jgi:hypothetical protein
MDRPGYFAAASAWLVNVFSGISIPFKECAFAVLASFSTNGSAMAGMDAMCQRPSVRAALRRLHMSTNQSTSMPSADLMMIDAASEFGVLILQYASAMSKSASKSFELSDFEKNSPPHGSAESAT